LEAGSPDAAGSAWLRRFRLAPTTPPGSAGFRLAPTTPPGSAGSIWRRRLRLTPLVPPGADGLDRGPCGDAGTVQRSRSQRSGLPCLPRCRARAVEPGSPMDHITVAGHPDPIPASPVAARLLEQRLESV